MSEQPQRYLSFLLRLWQTECEGEWVWRASLEKPGTSERQGFLCIQDLVRFLCSQTGEDPLRRKR